ncbi:MAG: hypothetical protein JRN11_04285 [Nitrososphaerota archaeon]|nr:hypothetical protein [Nitrososphaerota archaeon]
MAFGIPLTTGEIVFNGRLGAKNGRYRSISYDLAGRVASLNELKTGQGARGYVRRSNEVYFPGGRTGLKIVDGKADIEDGAVLIPKGDPHRVPNLAEDQELRFVPVFPGE